MAGEDIGQAIGSFVGGIASATGLGIGRSGMHPQAPSDILREAAQLGVSPLVLLGGGSALQGGFGASIGDPSGLGQNLSRAFSAMAPTNTKLQALQERNQELRNMALEQDIAANQFKLAHTAVSLKHPGSPPAFNAGMEGSPFFGPVNPFGGPHPTLQRNADGSISRTKEQAEIAFSGDPVAMVQNALESLKRVVPDPSPSPSEVWMWAQPWLSQVPNPQ